jgi:hypothetical protein
LILGSSNASCNLSEPSGSITFFANGGNQVCNYKSGELVDSPVNPPPTPIDCEKFDECGNIMAFAAEFYNPPIDCKQWNGPCNAQSEINRPGKVSIGTKKSAPDFQLTVKGGITTEQLKVCNVEWCDYVFADTFSLMGLQKVDAFIKAKGHLPNCTPGAEVAESGGFYLDEQTRIHQRKIEEVYLHLIGLNNRLDSIAMKSPRLGWWKRNTGGLFSFGKKETKSTASIKERERKVDFGPMSIQCSKLSSASGSSNADGVAGILVTGGTAPFKVLWTPNGGAIQTGSCDGFIKIPGLKLAC